MEFKKTNSYFCKKCHTTQTIPKDISEELKDIITKFCPVCLAKDKYVKMRELTNN